MKTKVKTTDELAAMRESGRMLATVLELLKSRIQAGMTTKDLSEIAKHELLALGGQPTFLGYYGFPDVLCVSVNDEVVHGIPSSKRIINDGDVVSFDFGVTYRGMITDAARTVLVGNGTDSQKRLIDYTLRSMDAGIATVQDGSKTGDIGSAVEAVLTRQNLGIVRDFVGHGVGHNLHEEPNVPNYGKKNTGTRLQTGMTIAIEPMATLGKDAVFVDVDGWTVKTSDGSLAAHFENTILVTETGAEVLTTL